MILICIRKCGVEILNEKYAHEFLEAYSIFFIVALHCNYYKYEFCKIFSTSIGCSF